jgi:glutamate-ammonia-ligase adenylyltransferase
MEDERTTEQTRTKNLKAGKGGLLDLEFAVQALQMRHFGVGTSIGSGNTLEAIEQFGALRLLKKAELDALQRNFRFLRDLEFLIRLNSEANDFVIPTERNLLRALAAGMRTRSVQHLTTKIRLVRNQNRKLLSTILATIAK